MTRDNTSLLKVVVVAVLLICMAIYFVVGSFGLVMGAFCFDQGQSPGAWSCFAGINAIFSLPPILGVLAAWIQFFRGRLRSSLILGTLPLALIALAYIALFFITSSYF